MKILTLEIHNVGLIADTKVTLDKPLIIFYGEIRQGKSTILNAVRWCFGGSFPADIIRHGEKEAHVELTFEGGCIRREWYISKKDGVTKARDVQFVRNGKPVDSPVAEIKRMLNPFLLNQDFFREKNEADRKSYMVDLFGVDTKALDTELFNNERSARELRSKISGYGEIELVEITPVDVTAVKAERSKIVDAHGKLVADWKAQREAIANELSKAVVEVTTANNQATLRTLDIERQQRSAASLDAEIERLKKALDDAAKNRAEIIQWIESHPPIAQLPLPDKPDTSELDGKIQSQPDTAALDTQISEAAATNVRYENYLAAKKRADEKAVQEKKLQELEARAKQIKKERAAKLKEVSSSTGIAELEFDDAGNFTYQGTSAGMLSTSQLMKLSEELSAKYPEGFGLDLLDRGESMGKSIFSLIERAQKEEKTILATVVGESPAKSPPEVGVFVVESGNVKEQQLL